MFQASLQALKRRYEMVPALVELSVCGTFFLCEKSHVQTTQRSSLRFLDHWPKGLEMHMLAI